VPYNPETQRGGFKQLITRMGAEHLEKIYAEVIGARKQERGKVGVKSDLLHGNTIKHQVGFKTA